MHSRRSIKAAAHLTAVIALAAVFSSAARAQVKAEDYPPPKPAFPGQTNAPAPAKPSPALKVETIITRFNGPWSLAIMPNGKMLVTERYGFIRVAEMNGFYSAPIAGVPDTKIVAAESLHDVVLDPDFAHNRMIYFTYFAPPPGETPGSWPLEYFYANVWKASVSERRTMRVGEERLARARLSDDERRLENVEVLLDGVNRRIVFAPDGTLFITGADRFRFYEAPYDGTDHEINDPDILRNFTGRVARINKDGSIPKDNPFLDQPTVLPETYSYGHRDPEGAAINPTTGKLWVIEHGPLGGDKLSIIKPGGNYGWPNVSYGRRYNGDLVAGKGADPGARRRAARLFLVSGCRTLRIDFLHWRHVSGVEGQRPDRRAGREKFDSPRARWRQGRRRRAPAQGPEPARPRSAASARWGALHSARRRPPHPRLKKVASAAP